VVQAIPEGTPSIVPHLVVRGGSAAIDFYIRAFGAVEIARIPGPDRQSVMHADLRIGNARLYLADEFPGMGRSPLGLKGTPVTIHLWFPDVDGAFARAVGAGAKVVMPLQDMFWGDRYGQVTDPFGHVWALASHKEDLSMDERMRRAAAAFPPPAPARKKSAPRKKAATRRAKARKTSGKAKPKKARRSR
jgi:PhnB protein